jgi:hypothetical protein
MDSKVLRPLEMEEFICNIDSAFRYVSEREEAEKAVGTAKSAVMSATTKVSTMVVSRNSWPPRYWRSITA